MVEGLSGIQKALGLISSTAKKETAKDPQMTAHTHWRESAVTMSDEPSLTEALPFG